MGETVFFISEHGWGLGGWGILTRFYLLSFCIPCPTLHALPAPLPLPTWALFQNVLSLPLTGCIHLVRQGRALPPQGSTCGPPWPVQASAGIILGDSRSSGRAGAPPFTRSVDRAPPVQGAERGQNSESSKAPILLFLGVPRTQQQTKGRSRLASWRFPSLRPLVSLEEGGGTRAGGGWLRGTFPTRDL